MNNLMVNIFIFILHLHTLAKGITEDVIGLTGLYNTLKNPTLMKTPQESVKQPSNKCTNDTSTPTQIELGHSSCRYSGNHDANNTACYDDAFEINKLPTNECTSYIYDGISCTDDSKIIPNYSPDDLILQSRLQKYLVCRQ